MRLIYSISFFAVIWCGLATMGTAHATDYNCVPLEVSVLDNRVHVQCAEPAPKTRGSYPKDTGHSIIYFAVALSSDQAWVDRFIQTANISINTGLPLRFGYTSGDYSGEAYGCVRANCRKPWAISLLKTAVVP